jgi:hypothetical protein
MPWWGWVIVGAVLLGAELLAVEADFYLVILGAAAVLVGLGGAAGLTGPRWAQWAIFGALAIVLLVVARRRMQALLLGGGPPPAGGYEALIGEIAVAQGAIPPGGIGQAELRGSLWSARNAGSAPLAGGQRARVQRVEGLVIELRGEE